MKALLGVVCVLVLLYPPCSTAQTHVFGGLTQAAVDRVLQDTKYPVTLINQSALLIKAKPHRNIVLTEQQVQALVDEAIAKGCPNKNARLACAVKGERDKLERMIIEAKAAREKAGDKWEGESVSDLETQARGCFETRLVVTHLNVSLLDRPGVVLGGSGIAVNDVHLSTDVTVRLQSKLPQWVCDKTCPVIGCCWGHVECNDWQTVLTVKVDDIKTTTSGQIKLETSGAKVLGTPELTKFLINIPIVGDVDITGLVNLFLKPQQMTIYDAKALVASIPIIKTSYQIRSLTLSGSGELRVDVELESLP